MKRCFDFFCAACGLLVLLPFMFLIAVTIIASDGTPVLFRQKRVGRNGILFTLFKFRSMSVVKNSDVNGMFNAGDISRVTGIGKFLRKWKLDELPQLWNVVRGDMSLVGPRPEIKKWVDVYPCQWERVLQVRPGITDPASIFYRNEEELLAKADDPEACYRSVVLPHKLELYTQYVQQQSFFKDIKIIFQTVWSLVWIKVGKK